MKILLFGKNGQIGWELQKSLAHLGELILIGSDEVNFKDLDAIRRCVSLNRPDFIINAAAYTAVDRAEVEAEETFLINEIAVGVLAEEALKLNCWLIHYSTDYVFDGKKISPYIETDKANPLNIYGQAKLNGENAIGNAGCKHLIFRSSWVYSTHGENFPFAILKRAINQDRIEVIGDNFGAPTSASLIANITANVIYRLTWDSLLESSATGIYHLVATGKTSWYGYAKLLVGIARNKGLPIKVSTKNIFPVGSESYKSLAKRPQNSQLDNKKLCNQFGFVLPDWEVDVERFVDELIKTKRL